MRNYDDIFAQNLANYNDTDIYILSNYSTDPSRKPFMKNIFTVNKLIAILLIIRYYLFLLWLVFKKRHTHFIYISYGGYIDVIFMSLSIISKRITIDIHEVYMLDLDNRKFIKIFLNYLYCNFISSVIIHSKHSKELLKKINYKGKIFEVPLFKYHYNKNISLGNIGNDVLLSIKNNRINILFFGYIRPSKGVDILSEAFCSLSFDNQNQFNLIVAGNDPHKIISKYEIINNKNVALILRYISDDELAYLFSNIDYVVLPYKEVSQSAVLETAFYFRKPILASRILSLEQILLEYPSFGLLFENNAIDLCDTISSLPNLPKKFYKDDDVKMYEQKDQIDIFIKEFLQFIRE
jgi:glycosyltransferase involved in cell wall biosynthesis